MSGILYPKLSKELTGPDSTDAERGRAPRCIVGQAEHDRFVRNSLTQVGQHPPGWPASYNLKHTNYKPMAPAYAIIASPSERPRVCILQKK